VKRVLLLATTTGYQIRSFGEAAEALGVRLVIGSDRCDRLEDPWWDGAIPVRFHDPDASVDAVTTAWQGPPPSGVIAVGDRPTVLAARLAAAFGLPGNPVAAAEASRDKRATRRAFAAAGLLTPPWQVFPTTQNPSIVRAIEYPAVIKPLALSGSRGVMRVDGEDALVAAVHRIRHLLQAPDIAIQRDGLHDFVLVESFVPGREYAIEGALSGGTLTVFAIFDKPDPLDGPFFEETIYVTPSRAASGVQKAMVDAVAAAARALGLTHGPVHAECRVNDRGVYVLEVAARPIGGLCSRAVRLEGPGGIAITLEEVLLRHAIGEGIDQFRQAARASGVMMIPIPRRGIWRGVTGVDRARDVSGVEDLKITAKPDAILVPLPEGRSYLGFIFASADTPTRVEGALREAHARLSFAIERELTMAENNKASGP
jgi:ABC-type sugar transport system substrate-binding protein